ncbi:MAG: AAA family ATPase [Clostridiales bacterium]|nr:AAA family ATPase [Clostridiales bacterium]
MKTQQNRPRTTLNAKWFYDKMVAADWKDMTGKEGTQMEETKQVIATGVQDFENLRMNDSFYVDKTDFIREWWNSRDAVTLITRPRRFGKTLNMSMLNCFFSNQYANRGELFDGLKVWKHPDMREQQGKWPVIFLTFADIKHTCFQDTRTKIHLMLVGLYNQYHWLLNERIFTETDREFYRSVRKDMDDATASGAIARLCEWLCRFYGKKVLIFLDEYDTPLQEAYIYGYWNEMAHYIRSLFNSTFKTNPCLERAVMTGITRVSKESIFSDLNNLVVITTTSNQYATSFGFTEAEVFASLDQQGFGEEDKLKVKSWYDGFTFGSVSDIYNPWSVTNFLNTGEYRTWWANTSGNCPATN